MSIVLVELVAGGWSVLSDRLVPTMWVDGVLIAHPRDAPVLISQRRALRAELEGVPVRLHTDAVAVDVQRAAEPQPILAFVDAGIRRPDEPVMAQLNGHERFSAASLVMVGGVMAGVVDPDEVTPADVMRTHMAIAALPFGRLRFRSDTLDVDMAELGRWWMSITAAPEAS